MVLEACIDRAVADGGPLLVEATCNQVNQEGGYTGMQPADFRDFVLGLAAARGLPAERLILGGDHLGPNPWRHEPAEAAMAKAETLVRSYAEAGFAKIHLDASMACAGDPEPLPPEVIAAARRPAGPGCRGRGRAGPSTSIGTEVPVPGGAHETIDQLEVTRTEDLARTIEVHGPRSPRPGSTRPGRGCWRWSCSPASSSAARRWSTSCPSARTRSPPRSGRCPGSPSRPTRPTTRPRPRWRPWSRAISPSSRWAPA